MAIMLLHLDSGKAALIAQIIVIKFLCRFIENIFILSYISTT